MNSRAPGWLEHVLRDLGVLAVEVPEFGDPEGVRQEARVGDEVGVGGEPVLEAEAQQRDAQAGSPGLGERSR